MSLFQRQPLSWYYIGISDKLLVGLLHTHKGLYMTSTWYLTSLFPSDLFSSLLPNDPSPSVPINTCNCLSWLVVCLGRLSWLGVGRCPTKMPLRYTWKTNPPRFIISTSSNPPLPQHIQRHTPASVFIDRPLSSEGVWRGVNLWAPTPPLPQPSQPPVSSHNLSDRLIFPYFPSGQLLLPGQPVWAASSRVLGPAVILWALSSAPRSPRLPASFGPLGPSTPACL